MAEEEWGGNGIVVNSSSDYPPDMQEKATGTVLNQAEVLCAEVLGDTEPSKAKVKRLTAAMKKAGIKVKLKEMR